LDVVLSITPRFLDNREGVFMAMSKSFLTSKSCLIKFSFWHQVILDYFISIKDNEMIMSPACTDTIVVKALIKMISIKVALLSRYLIGVEVENPKQTSSFKCNDFIILRKITSLQKFTWAVLGVWVKYNHHAEKANGTHLLNGSLPYQMPSFQWISF